MRHLTEWRQEDSCLPVSVGWLAATQPGTGKASKETLPLLNMMYVCCVAATDSRLIPWRSVGARASTVDVVERGKVWGNSQSWLKVRAGPRDGKACDDEELPQSKSSSGCPVDTGQWLGQGIRITA